MSLQSQLNSFVTRVAELFQQVETRTGPLAHLDTDAKSDLVAAINELAARPTVGGGSSSGVAYQHNQVSAAGVWTINHNLGFRPSVSILDTGGNEIEADVRHTSTNQLVIYFAIPLAGVARLT
jgi:hypothetical protein